MANFVPLLLAHIDNTRKDIKPGPLMGIEPTLLVLNTILNDKQPCHDSLTQISVEIHFTPGHRHERYVEDRKFQMYRLK